MATQTYGEALVAKRLEELCKVHKNKFFFMEEPMIPDKTGGIRPDFVLVSQKKGVYVIEVKDWVEFTDGCNQESVYIRKRSGDIVKHKNPYETARGYCLALVNRLERRTELMHRHRGHDKLKFPWQEIVILPNIPRKTIQQFYDTGIWPEDTVLGREDVHNVESLIEALNRINMKFDIKNGGLDQKALDAIRATVDPVLIVGERGTETIQQTKIIREKFELPDDDILTDEAKDVSTATNIRLVRGVAGSGKTLVLMRRAKYLRYKHPDSHILILTYNKDLMEDTRRRIDDPSIDVVNFHKLCADVFKAAGRKWQSPLNTQGWLNHSPEARAIMDENNLDAEFVAEEFAWRKEAGHVTTESYLTANRRGRGKALQQNKREVIDTLFQQYLSHQQHLERQAHAWADWADVPEITKELLSRPKHTMRAIYDVIMIDEGQDFAPSWVEVVQKLLKPQGTLFLCDDPTQSLFRSFTWAERGIEVRGRTRVLRIPFRSTRQISQAAHALVQSHKLLRGNPDIPTPDFGKDFLVDGDIPRLVACHNQDEEVSWIKQFIQQTNDPSRVAILIHNHKLVKHLATLRNSGAYVESFRKMKGLEFPIVIVPFLDSIFKAPHTPDDEDEDEQTTANQIRQLFTAMTRAEHSLCLTYHGRLPVQLTPVVDHVYREYP
jgi:hypothetical protein